jgi:hypothetical protein
MIELFKKYPAEIMVCCGLSLNAIYFILRPYFDVLNQELLTPLYGNDPRLSFVVLSLYLGIPLTGLLAFLAAILVSIIKRMNNVTQFSK